MIAVVFRTISQAQPAFWAVVLILLAAVAPARAADEAARKLLPDDLQQKGVLTAAMFRDVFAAIRAELDRS